MKKLTPVQKHCIDEVKVAFSDSNPEIERMGRDLHGDGKVDATIRIDGDKIGIVRTSEPHQLNIRSVSVEDTEFVEIYGDYHGIDYVIKVKTRNYSEEEQ